MATAVHWDPSGRYLLTFQSILRYQMESSYMLWDFRGQLLHRVPVEKLKFAAWRPRPVSLLSVAQQKAVLKKLKDLSLQFDMEDAEKAQQWISQGKASKLQMKEDWLAWRRIARAQWHLDTSASTATGGASLSGSAAAGNEIVDWVEELLEETEELIE